MARLTIRARLTLVYGGLFLLAGVLLLAVTYVLVSQQLPGPGGYTVSITGTPGAVQGTPGTGQDPAPPVLSRTDVIPGSADPVPAADGSTLNQVAEDTWQDALNALLTQGGIALAVVGIAATAFGWLLAGRLLQPLHRVTETARRIADAPAADRGLHERIALDGSSDEIKELADTFDVMLARLDHAFDGQRRFIANASHELRTPLTVNRSVLEVALYRTAATPELRHVGQVLLEMNRRQERLLDGLLLLARSEREVTERAYVDLADIVEHVAARTVPGTVAVRTEPDEAPTSGNPVLLERLVQNLVDNGVRHNLDDGGWVHVTCGPRSGDTVEVRVTNTGPVVPRYEVPRLFEPFHRLDNDRLDTDQSGTEQPDKEQSDVQRPSTERPSTEHPGADRSGPRRSRTAAPGAGLGLSIVQAVARAHGGEVHARPRDGGGLEVTVILPSAP